jgi:hypothetical protein
MLVFREIDKISNRLVDSRTKVGGAHSEFALAPAMLTEGLDGLP